MGKSITDLFKNKEFVFAGTEKPTTAKKHFEIRNSKDIKVSSSSNFMRPPFFLLNVLRKKIGERKHEHHLEQELSGLAPLRLISTPIIYGTDLIRLTTKSTSDVENMKNSANGSRVEEQNLPEYGRDLRTIRDKVENSKFLGIPKKLYPTSYLEDLKKTSLWEIPEKLSEIKESAEGKILGKILKESAGSFAGIQNRVVEAGVNLGKKALKKAIFGETKQIRGVDVFENMNPSGKIFRMRPLWSNESEQNYSKKRHTIRMVGDDIEETFNLDLRGIYTDSKIFAPPTYFKENAFIPSIKFSYDIQNNPLYWDNKQIYSNFHKNQLYSKSPKARLNNLAPENYDPDGDGKTLKIELPYKEDINTGQILTDENLNIKINVNDLRPSALNYKKNADDKDKPSYSKGTGGFVRGITARDTLNGNLDHNLENRGVGAYRNIVNQSGRFNLKELTDVKGANGESFEKVDLIPLRFQKLNDLSAIYMSAAIKSFSETFTPDWQSKQFVGNPFKFYQYSSIERKVSFTIQAYALSQVELVMMWRKINFLSHLTYPFTFTSAGAAEPTIFALTLGSMYVDKPAILTSLTYTLNDENTTWEIGPGPSSNSDQLKNRTAKIGKGRYEPNFDKHFIVKGDENKTWVGDDRIRTPQTNDQYDNPSILWGLKGNGLNKINENDPQIVAERDTEEGKNRKPIEYQEVFQNTTDPIDMEQFKLPKIIEIQLEITFLESPSISTKNLYGFGKPITSGIKPNRNSNRQGSNAARRQSAADTPATNVDPSKAIEQEIQAEQDRRRQLEIKERNRRNDDGDWLFDWDDFSPDAQIIESNRNQMG